MKLPAFQFYPGDWRKDPGVQALDYFARGVWFEILCLMHESDVRGVLLLNCKAMPPEALASLLGLPLDLLNQNLSKIEAYGVASRESASGALMCRRMVRDEEIREIRREAGKQGGNPNLVNQNSSKAPSKSQAKKQNPVNQKSTPSSSSSSSISSSTSSSDSISFSPSEVKSPSNEGTPFGEKIIEIVEVAIKQAEETGQAKNDSLNADQSKASHTRGGGGEIELNHSKAFTDTYCSFYEQRVGVKPDFTKADGVAAAGLRKFLKENCNEKSEEGALKALQFIFHNWDKLEAFYQDQLKLSQIKSNINNIMNQVKNGTAKKQSTNQGKPSSAKPSFAGVAAIVDYMSKQDKFV